MEEPGVSGQLAGAIVACVFACLLACVAAGAELMRARDAAAAASLRRLRTNPSLRPRQKQHSVQLLPVGPPPLPAPMTGGSGSGNNSSSSSSSEDETIVVEVARSRAVRATGGYEAISLPLDAARAPRKRTAYGETSLAERPRPVLRDSTVHLAAQSVPTVAPPETLPEYGELEVIESLYAP